MSPEERQLLVELFQRTNAAAGQPRDRDAEAFIAEAVRLQPFAPYLLAQTVIVQEQALKAAADRLQQLETENRDLQARAQSGAAQQGGFLGGIGGLFGGGQQQPAAPPRQNSPWGAPQQQQGAGWGAQPQQPSAQPGPWGGAPPQQQAGGGVLKGALGMAAGVAGGALLANSISGLFHGSGANHLGIGSGFGAQQAGLGGGDTVINNYYGDRNDDRSGDMHRAADNYDDGNDAHVSDADWGGDDSGSDDSYDV